MPYIGVKKAAVTATTKNVGMEKEKKGEEDELRRHPEERAGTLLNFLKFYLNTMVIADPPMAGTTKKG